MDEEQNRKFYEWLSTTLRVYRVDLEKAWRACLDANKVEEQKPEPSPTEMVKRLLEKGWTVEAYPDTDMTFFRSPDGKNRLALIAAYHKAFPPKKKVEVEVWLQQCPDNKHKVRETGYFGMAGHDLWTKGTATFWVEEEQPCTSEDGSS